MNPWLDVYEGLFEVLGTFFLVVWLGLYIEAHWIGLPGQKPTRHE